MAEIESGTRFHPVLADPTADKAKAKRVVMLSGKVYYELVKERQTHGLDNAVAFIRIEELAPFPFEELQDVLEEYPNAEEYIWLQEEPKNQGAFGHVAGRISSVLARMGRGEKVLTYVGRKESPLPAPGVGKLYQAQQKAVLEGAFGNLSLT